MSLTLSVLYRARRNVSTESISLVALLIHCVSKKQHWRCTL